MMTICSAKEFIQHEEIVESLSFGKKQSKDISFVRSILDKAKEAKGLTHREAAVLLNVNDPEILEEMYQTARGSKSKSTESESFFCSLYVSSYCVNNCVYCGYKHSNTDLPRRKLTMEELKEEIESLNH